MWDLGIRCWISKSWAFLKHWCELAKSSCGCKIFCKTLSEEKVPQKIHGPGDQPLFLARSHICDLANCNDLDHVQMRGADPTGMCGGIKVDNSWIFSRLWTYCALGWKVLPLLPSLLFARDERLVWGSTILPCCLQQYLSCLCYNAKSNPCCSPCILCAEHTARILLLLECLGGLAGLTQVSKDNFLWE